MSRIQLPTASFPASVWWKAALAVTCFTLLLVAHHLAPGSMSMLTFQGETFPEQGRFLAEDYLQFVVDFHQENPAFVRRPLTTQLVSRLQYFFGLSVGWAFLLANFSLLWGAAYALFGLTLRLFQRPEIAYWSLIGFFTTFSLCFAFFPKIYSYDEPMQYLLLLLALLFWWRQRWLLFGLTFALSLLSRESGLLLLPALGWWAWQHPPTRQRALLALLVPTLLYGAYYLSFFYGVDTSAEARKLLSERQDALDYNFANLRFARESLVSVGLAAVWPAIVVVLFPTKSTFGVSLKPWKTAFWISLAINTPVIFLTARAQETRLFALPLLFLWPIVGASFARFWSVFQAVDWGAGLREKWYLFIGFSLVFLGNLWIYLKVTIPTGFYKTDNWQDEYLLLLSSLVAFIVMVRLLSSENVTTPSPK
ncbi:MAG: hypothetical protein ACFB10_21935 [Salibacteraceae bacterium]